MGLLITGRGKASGVAAPALHAWQVNWFVDGKTARRQAFLEWGDALEAVARAARL